jgi:hypothetical protein
VSMRVAVLFAAFSDLQIGICMSAEFTRVNDLPLPPGLIHQFLSPL